MTGGMTITSGIQSHRYKGEQVQTEAHSPTVKTFAQPVETVCQLVKDQNNSQPRFFYSAILSIFQQQVAFIFLYIECKFD